MRKPFKMRGNPFKRNFGIGPGLSPYKAEEEKTEEKKPEIVENVVGGDKEKGDKGWVKGLKAATTMLSHGLASVYGGTAHTPKINWGKREKEVKQDTPGQELLNELDNKENEQGTNYEIKSGDTLGAIAAANNTTVEELMKKNPGIKDKNKITAGQTINL